MMKWVKKFFASEKETENKKNKPAKDEIIRRAVQRTVEEYEPALRKMAND